MAVKSVAKILVAIALWVLVFYWVPLDSLLANLKQAESSWIFLALVLSLLVKAGTAIRMHYLARLQEMPLGFGDMIRVIFATAFYGLFLPGGAAGGAVTFAKYVQYGATAPAALTNLLVNKGLELLAAVYLGLVFWAYDYSSAAIWPLLLAPVVLVVLVWILHLVVANFSMWSWLCRQADDRHWRIAPALMRLESQLSKVQGVTLGQWFILVVMAICMMALAALGMQAFACALGIEISFTVTLWIYCLLAVLALLPISFSNVGVREASLLLLVPAYGVSESQAIAWSVLLYGAILAPALFGALTESLGRRNLEAIAGQNGSQSTGLA